MKIRTKYGVSTNERGMELTFVERDVVEEYVWSPKSDQPVDMDLLLLRVAKDSAAQLFVVKRRPSRILHNGKYTVNKRKM